MKQLLTPVTLLIVGAVGVRTQQPFITRGMANGVLWRGDSQQERMSYVEGALEGFQRGSLTVVQNGGCSVQSIPSWLRVKISVADTMKEMDAFYQDGANISLRMLDAFVYSRMKLAGATKQELDDYRRIAANAATK